MSIQYKFFTVPVKDSTLAETELNRFLRSVRVLTVHREFIDQSGEALWALAVG